MKKKKYGWPKRCLSLICVLVLIGMIVLQSVPVTYASDNDGDWQSTELDTFTSEPGDNETPPDVGIQTEEEQLLNETFSEGNEENTGEIAPDGNSDVPADTTENGDSDISPDQSSESDNENGISNEQQNEITADENLADEAEPEEKQDSEQQEQGGNSNPLEENEDIWRNSVASAVLSNDYAKDLVAIARTQLGVQENRDNFITVSEGVNHYYSRYGQWAGDAYEEWSAAFVNFCIYYANIPQQYLPKSENTAQWIQQLEAMSLHIEKEGYTPQEGDLVFFLTNEHADGNSQIQSDVPGHTGIVTGADEQTLYTIEGNCGGMVQSETYALGSDNIYGYLDMDQVKKLAGVLPAEPTDPADPETPVDSDNPDQTEDENQQDEENPDSEEEKKDEEKQDEESEEFSDEEDSNEPSMYGHVLLSDDSQTQANLINEKYIRKNRTNGTYDIILNVSGNVEREITTANIDIVLLIDVSSSMDESSKIENTKQAVSRLVTAFKEKEATVDTKYKLVTFGTGADIVTSKWVDGDTVNTQVNNIQIGEAQGTNYDQGLRKTNTALSDARSDARKIVIFLTDGEPTFYGTPVKGGPWGQYANGRGSTTSVKTLEAAKTAAGLISCDQFYGVGVTLKNSVTIYKSDSTNSDKVDRTEKGLDILSSVISSANVSERCEAWNLSDPSELTDKFSDIAGLILNYNCTDVKITDTLSDYVDLTEDSMIQFKLAKLTGTDYSDIGSTEIPLVQTTGKDVIIAGKNYGTAVYNSSSRTVTWSLGADYGLEQDMYYYMKITNVIPSQKAYDVYRTSGYPNVGGNPTDTDEGEYRAVTGGLSSGKEGFYSNSSANVSYKWKEENPTLSYLNPVIQLDGADLDLKKTDMQFGLLEGSVFKLEKMDADGNWQTVTGYGEIHVNNADTAIEIKKLTSGDYKLTETEAPKGFQCMKEGICFKVKNNTVSLEKQSSRISTGMYTLTPASGGQTQILTIKNQKVYNLPSTGGSGTDLFTISGAVIMTGALLLYINKRKEEKAA